MDTFIVIWSKIIELLEILIWPVVILIACLIFRKATNYSLMKRKSKPKPKDAEYSHNKNTNKFLAWGTFIMAAATFLMVILTWQSNVRTGKIFVGQNKPLIDVSPVNIKLNKAKSHSTISFSITNYSGFDAYDITIDTKYGGNYKGDNAWHLKWKEADNERIRKINEKVDKKGIAVEPNEYPLPPQGYEIKKLRAGQTVNKNFKGEAIAFRGSLHLEKKYLASDNRIKGYPIFVRITWKNEKGHVFDEIHKYSLIWTRVSDSNNPNDLNSSVGWAFTLIPEGIISKKD